MRTFRYKVNSWDELENKQVVDTGFVIGINYPDAMKNLIDIYTDPQGKDNVIEASIYEVDGFNTGVIPDCLIKEAFEIENKESNK